MNQLSVKISATNQNVPNGTIFTLPSETTKKQTKYMGEGTISRPWASDNKGDP